MLRLLITLFFPLSILCQTLDPIQIGGNTFDQVRSFEIDSQGNKYITGIFSGSVDFDLEQNETILFSSGSADVFLAKYDPNNTLEWVIGIGGNDYDYANDLVLTNNAVIIGGYFSSTSTIYNSGGTIDNLSFVGGQDLFLLKVDTDGNLDWSHGMGSTQNDQLTSIAIDGNENIFISGNFMSTIDVNPDGSGTNELISTDGQDCFIAKYDQMGNFITAISIAGQGTDAINDIEIDQTTNDIYLAGFFENDITYNSSTSLSQGFFDVFIAKMDSDLNEDWIYTAGGSQSDQAISLCINANGICVAGRFSDSFDFGSGNTITSINLYDTFLSLLSPSGLLTDIITIGGNGLVEPDIIKVDDFGNYYVGGTFNTDVTEPNLQLNSAGSDDIYLLKFDATLQLESSNSFGSSSSEGLADLFVQSEGSIWIGGFFQNTVSFGTQPTVTVTSNGSSDAMVFYVEGSSFAEIKEQNKNEIILYPNPTSDYLYLKTHSLSSVVSLIDSHGRTTIANNNYKSGKPINTQTLSQGLYYIKIKTPTGGVQTLQFVKH